MVSQVRLSVSITRNYGAVSATFGAQYDVDVKPGVTVGASYQNLLDLVHHQFEQYESHDLKREAPAAPGQGKAPAAPIEPQWFWAIKLVRNVVKGKEQFFIITKESAYAKHGVPCYPEFLRDFKLIEALDGKYELSFKPGTRVRVDTSGKYVKAMDMDFVKAR